MTTRRPGGDQTTEKPLRIAVVPESREYADVAGQLALRVKLPLLHQGDPLDSMDLFLSVGPKGLTLKPSGPRAGTGIRIDFVQGPTAFRRVATGSKKQPLARAIGLRDQNPNVIDATAGLGRDAFLLACLGCTVRAVERSPILAEMLVDALLQAASHDDPRLQVVAGRIRVTRADATVLLRGLHESDRPDVVYLDPMYTPSGSSALSKKEMRIVRMLVGPDRDAPELLDAARHAARKRVVVKRHLRAPPLAQGRAHSHLGRSVRYDVYAPIQSPPSLS